MRHYILVLGKWVRVPFWVYRLARGKLPRMSRERIAWRLSMR
jgi:hypothetical protein